LQADQEIRDEVDRSIGEGPPGVPVDDLLTRGHRALGRRRLLAGTGATLAVVAIVGGGAVALGGAGTQGSPAPRYAEQPSASPATPTSAPAPALRTPSQREANRALSLPLAKFDDRGRLVLAPQVEVVRRIDDPFGSRSPGTSVALELEYRRVRYWFFLYQAPDRSHWETAYMWPGDYDGSFASWVEEQRPNQEDDPSSGEGQGEWPGIPDLDLVRFVGSSERLEPVAGVTILRQRAHVFVGESFAGPNGQTAAAKVETGDGERYYVIARRVAGGGPQYIAVTEADGGPSLSSFLDLARSRYADNGGGLL
jgi:hypothetical protein